MRKVTIITALVAALLLMPAMPFAQAILPAALSVSTEFTNYRAGEVVKTSGVATIEGTVSLSFKVGVTLITTVTESAGADGKYECTYSLPTEPTVGTWTIEAKDSADKTATTSFTVLKANPKEIANKLFLISQTSENLVEEQLGDSPPKAAKENYDAGVKALEEAQSLLTSEQYSASIQASLRAQKHFGNALKILTFGHPQQTIDDETRLTSQIDRAQNMLDSLQKLYDNVKDKLTTENSDSINTALTDAQKDIDDAKTELADKDYTQTQSLLTNALDHMKTARTLLQDYASDRKKEQIISFIDKAEERIDKLEAAVEKLKERIGATEASEIIDKLEDVRGELETLRGLATDGDSTLTELSEQMIAIQEAIGELRDTSLREALKEMDSMQAWIQLMKETRGIWMKKGLNTDDLDAKIHLGENTLGQTISELASGRKMGSRFPDIIQSFRDAFRNRGH